jgi:hypothetical protein
MDALNAVVVKTGFPKKTAKLEAFRQNRHTHTFLLNFKIYEGIVRNHAYFVVVF